MTRTLWFKKKFHFFFSIRCLCAYHEPSEQNFTGNEVVISAGNQIANIFHTNGFGF